MIRAVEVRCTGNKGHCRRLVAVLLWPEDLSEGVPTLKVARVLSYTVPRDLSGDVRLGCARHNGSVDQRTVELRPLLADALADALASGKAVTVAWDPRG